jgi:hypothetical protein
MQDVTPAASVDAIRTVNLLQRALMEIAEVVAVQARLADLLDQLVCQQALLVEGALPASSPSSGLHDSVWADGTLAAFAPALRHAPVSWALVRCHMWIVDANASCVRLLPMH